MRLRWLAAVLALALAACNDDGRVLAPAPTTSSSTTTALTESASPQGSEGGATEFTLSSPFFVDGGSLGIDFTCDGLDVHPELVVDGVPPAAAELAVALEELDSVGEVRWVMAGIAPHTSRIETGVVPPGVVFATSSDGIAGWDGPCPPAGAGPRAYRFSAYALPEPVGLAPGVPGRQAIELLEAAAVTVDRLSVSYPAVDPEVSRTSSG